MKIKCPGCSSVLQIPESAAGKVVKCKCGKQLRAPGGQASGSQASGSQASGSQPAARGAAPAAQRPSASPSINPGLFDELTDTDLAPVKGVHTPGSAPVVKAPTGAAAKLLNEAISGSDRRGQALAMKGLPPRPGLLTFVGVINGFWAVFYFASVVLTLGLIAVIPALEDAVAQYEGSLLYWVVGLLVLSGLLSLAVCVASFTRGKSFWYLMLVAYGWFLGEALIRVGLMATGDTETPKLIGAGVGILVRIGFWAAIHGSDVKAFYQTEKEPLGKIIAADVAGFLLGIGVSAAVFFFVGNG